MDAALPKEASALILGAGIAVGEAFFAVNGPFLFNRFGLSDSVAAFTGVLTGAVIGFGVAAAVCRYRAREAAVRGTGHGIPYGHADLRGVRTL